MFKKFVSAAAARLATRRRMSVTSAGGRESVSAQGLGGRGVILLTRPPIVCRNRRFPRLYVEPLSEARTKLTGFFNSLRACEKEACHDHHDGSHA